MGDAPSSAVLAAARVAAPPVHGGRKLRVWATCAPGLEPEAGTELAALGWAVEPDARDGAVVGTASEEILAGSARGARTVQGLHLLLADTELPSGGLEELRHADIAPQLSALLAEALSEIDVPLWPTSTTIAVRAERRGTHPFTSIELGAAAASVLLEAYRRTTGHRPVVDLDDPDLELRVALHDTRLLVGLTLSGERHRRSWRRAAHRAGLDATVAAGLLLRAGWRADESLLDPCCGAGTILVEAGLAVAARPPDGTAAARGEPAVARLHGRDRRGAALRDAAANLAAAGVTADLARGDLRRHLEVAAVDVVIANPPFGVRVGHPGDIERLTRQGLALLADLLTARGRIVWLTRSVPLVRDAAHDAGLAVRRASPLWLGDLEVQATELAWPGALTDR